MKIKQIFPVSLRCAMLLSLTATTALSGMTLTSIAHSSTARQVKVPSVRLTNAVNFPGGEYTREQINYFLEVALGSEYAANSATIRKWQGDIRIKVNGKPTPQDIETLNTVIADINNLVSGVRLQLDDNNPNLNLYFVPESSFKRYEPNYQPVNYGFGYAQWDGNNQIYAANLLITTEGVTQTERSHLIREELTQSLGLMRDSYKYKNSIFYQDWTDVTEYAPIDKALIEMLYRSEIRPGMTKTQVIQALNQLQAQK